MLLSWQRLVNFRLYTAVLVPVVYHSVDYRARVASCATQSCWHHVCVVPPPHESYLSSSLVE